MLRCDGRVDCRRLRRVRHARGRRLGHRFRGYRRVASCGCGGLGGRRRRRRRLHFGHGHGLGRRRRRCREARRQQRQRIDVALLVRGQPDSEVDVRLRQVDRPARADGADSRSFVDVRPARDADGAEMHERGRVTGRRLNRHGLAALRHRPGERDHAARGCGDLCAGRSAEVDATMLPGGVRARTVERERPQHRPVNGPRPCSSGGNG